MPSEEGPEEASLLSSASLKYCRTVLTFPFSLLFTQVLLPFKPITLLFGPQ